MFVVAFWFFCVVSCVVVVGWFSVVVFEYLIVGLFVLVCSCGWLLVSQFVWWFVVVCVCVCA